MTAPYDFSPLPVGGVIYLTNAHERISPERQVSATDEIEITPEMIEAGLEEFGTYDSRFDVEEDVVKRIFLAMLRRSRLILRNRDVVEHATQQ